MSAPRTPWHGAKSGVNLAAIAHPELNELQREVLKASIACAALLKRFRSSDVADCMRASGLGWLVTGRATVGCAMKALSDRGHLYRLDIGLFALAPPAPPSRQANIAQGGELRPLRKADLVAGRAPVARPRREVNLEEPLWPEEAGR